MATEIRVPIRLEVLQDSISSIKATLANLKPDSSAWRALTTILQTMTKEADKLAITMSKPFTNQAQFNFAEKSIEKMEEGIDRARLAMSRIKFSDIKLSPEQAAAFEALKNEIKSIEQEINQFKVNAKASLQNSVVWDDIIKIDPNAATRTFDQLLKNVRARNSELQGLLQKAKSDLNEWESGQDRRDATQKLVDGAKFKDLLGEQYTDYFKANQAFKNEDSKKAFFDWVKNNLILSDEQIEQLKQSSGPKLDQVINNMKAEIKAKLDNLKIEGNQKQDTYNSIKEQSDSANRAVNAMGMAVDELAGKQANLRDREDEIVTHTQQLENALTNGARASEGFSTATSQMEMQLNNLKSTLSTANSQFLQMQRTQQSFNQMKMAVVNFMGFNQVLNLTKNAIRNAINHIQELDSVMNKISIVTDMSTGDLWDQVDAYSKMAQTYGVSIKGAYEVSQIYYQQGLETRDVMTLTNETLKLAKISGLDYATTTDYMTTALRGFKMEMSEAATVVDVYSNLAAHTAVSQEELAVAMSKTASSMESVGASFEESSAMIATMVAVTRESATNIGSAMKSIASRYGELTKDPTKLVDEEGEAMAFNKVDAALQSVGISMKTVDGQFREFTDVIIELGEKWNQLDSTQQRYIATQFAGNRQQSRFLALVSNVDLLKSNLNYAENAEDTGTLQALKALDSIEAKTEQVRVAYQQFYTTIGAESAWKGFLDGAKNVINTLNSLPKLFGKIPVGAVAAITSIITLIKNLGADLLNVFAEIFGRGIVNGAIAAQQEAQQGAQTLTGMFINTIRGKKGEAEQAGKELAQSVTNGMNQAPHPSSPQLTGDAQITYNKNTNAINMLSDVTDDISARAASVALLNQGNITLAQFGFLQNQGAEGAKLLTQTLTEQNNKLLEAAAAMQQNNNAVEQNSHKIKDWIANHKNFGQGLMSFGSALNMVAMTINTTAEGGKTLSGSLQLIAGTATMAGIAIKGIQAALSQTSFTVPWITAISAVMMLVNGLSTLIVTPQERLEELTKKAEDLNNKAKESKANYRTLDNSIKKIDELKEKRYESAEAAEEYQTAVDDLAEKFPQMIAGFDEAGNIILDTTDAERILAEARNKSKEATYAAAEAELKKAEEQKDQAKKALEQAQGQLGSQLFASTNDESYSVERRKYFNTKNYQDANGINRKIRDLITEGDFIETLYTISSVGTERELTANEVVEGVKEFNAALQKIGNQAYSFINEFTGETAEELYTYMQMYKSQHKASELTPEFFEIEQLVNEGLQIQINAAYQNTVKEINKLKDLDTDNEDFKSQIEIVNNAIHAYQDLVGENSIEFTHFDSVITALSDVNNAVKDYINMTEIYQGNSRAVVSAWQQSATANSQAWDVLSKSSFAAALVTEQIVNEIGDRDYDKLVKNNNETKKWRAYQEKVANFISSMDIDTLEKFNQMGNDTDNYTAEDIIKTFNITDKEIVLYIIEHYSKGAESIRSRLRESLSKVSGNTYQQGYGFDKIFKEDFYKQFNAITYKELTSIEEKYLNNILNQYEKLTKEGYVERAKTYGETALELFEIVNNKYSPEISKQLFQIILEHGLETLEGIINIKDDIRNNPNLKNINLDEYLNIISKNIIPNINLSIETEISNLLETWEDTSKELSKAMSGGLTLKEADALINKSKMLGMKEPININDFVLAGDKLILGYNDFKRYYESLQTSAAKSALVLEKHINAAKKVEISTLQAGYRQTDSKWMEEQRAILEAVGFNWSNAEYWTEGRLNTTGVQAYNDAIAITTEKWNSLNIAAQIAANQLMNAYERNEGIYKLNTNGNELSLTELNNIAKGLDIKGINQLGKDAITERAIKDQLNSVYNTLISDVLSKGFENINLDDYEGLITQNINGKRVTGIELGGSYEAFIRKYVEFAGLTIQEANDLIIQAIEKDQNLDIVSDVEQFAKASVGDTLNLTNFYNAYVKAVGKEQAQALTSRFSSMGMTFANGLGKLEKDANIPKIIQEIIKIARDKELLLEEEIAKLGDVLIEFLRALNDIINKGIEGTLSQIEANQLKEFGESQGLNLNFTNTTEGMKLTQASAIELYQAMQKIDQEAGTLASRTTFKNLMDGMIKGNEAYKDASANMARIAELSEAINRADANVSSARLQEYQAELAVAKEILMVRSTEEDSSFNFMDNKMPGGMYNPINYMENMAKAFNVIKDSFDPDKNGGHTGMIHAQDWYNIATEMGRIAQITGQEFTMAGVTLDGSMERTSELIQHGFDNLSGVDSGELMVNLPKMGFNFESAAAGLTDAMDDGIKELAKAEIASLDAMIAVLEIMVAMEKLGDVAGEDMNLDLGDVLIGGITGDAAEYTPAFQAWQDNIVSILESTEKGYEDIQRAFNSVSVNGKTLTKIAKQSAKEMTEADVQILNAFMKAGSSLNWNLDAIGASMEEIIKSSGIEDLNVNIVDEQLGIDVTYLVDAGVFYQINWNNKNAKNMLENMLIHDETGIKSAKDIAAEAVRHYNENPQTIGTEEIIQALATKNIIKVNDQGQYEILLGNGKSIAYQPNGNNAQFYDELAKITLKDLNLVGGGNVVPTNADPNVFGEGATQQITLGSLKFNARMTIDKDGTHLVYGDDKHGYNYESMDEYTDALFKEYQERNSYNKSNASKNYTTKEEYLYGEYNYRVPVKTTITNEKGEEITDLSQDPQAVEKLEALASGKGLEDIVAGQDNVELTQKATLNYDIEPSADIEKTKAKVQSAAREALGFNTKNIQEIAYGIQDALSSSDAQTAISNAISTGMETSLKGTDEIPLEAPSIKLTTKEVTVDLSGVNAEANGEVKPIEVDQITIKAKSAKVEWSNSEQGSENVLELEGKITKYNTEGATVEPLPETEGKIIGYNAQEATLDVQPETQGKITGYNADGIVPDQPEVEAKITGYNPSAKPENPQVEAEITSYKPASGAAETLKPDPIIADVTLNTETAEQQLNAWIDEQSNKTINITATTDSESNGINNANNKTPYDFKVNYRTNDSFQGYVVGTDNFNEDLYSFYDSLVGWVGQQSKELDLSKMFPNATEKDRAGIKSALLKYFNNNFPDYYNEANELITVGTDKIIEDATDQLITEMATKTVEDEEYQKRKWEEEHGMVQDQSFSESVDNSLENQGPFGKIQNNLISQQYSSAKEWYNAEGAEWLAKNRELAPVIAAGSISDVSTGDWYQQVLDAFNNQQEKQGLPQVKLNAEIEEIDTKKVDGKESAELKGVIDESNIEVKEAEDESQLPTTEVKGEFNSEEMQAALSEQTYTASVTTETTVTPTTPQTQEVTYTADTSELENQDLTLEGELIVNGESAEAEVAALKENAASGETMPIDANTSAGQSKLRAFVGMINSSAGKVKIDADDSLARNVLSQLKTDISNTKGTVKIDAQKSGGGEAKGSVSLAKGSGEALAGGRPTLMGELGPELVVSGGRYFIVGQAGAEMVNLDSDAIVFNHQQTASLLRNGKTSRGVPVTNENKAISWAKGNVNGGPAMASASAALAALKNMRAQWQALLSVSVKDLASQGGGGGGGGGGSDPKAFVKELEKWYNWMQQIAQLEKEITLEQAKREKYQSDMIARGREYYNSQMVTLDKLQQQIAVQKSLNDAQQEYFDQRRKELNQQSAFSALYGFGESGQLYYKKGIYKDGMTAFQWLSDLAGRDAKTGKANYTAKEQYQRLAAAGFDFAMQYDSSGNEIDREQDNWEEQAVQAFWDRIDADKEEMQSLHDTLEEGQKALLEKAQAQNEILKEIEENQISVEKKVLKAVEEIHQRQIDNMKDEKAALEKSTKDLTDGLDKQLKQEQNMYQDQKSADELSKLQRQLGILQRSGGSAVEIANLQNQIQEKQYDSYFNEQEKQIQAIKDASDAELERLDKQIELETELLAYQKEHGLLWAEVNEVLKNNPEDIANWLKENTEAYWGQSVTELAKTMREDLFELQKFKEFQEKVEGGMDALIAAYGVEVKEEAPEVKPIEEDSSANQGGNSTPTKGPGGISDEERNKLIKRAMREGQARGEKEAQEQIKKHKKAAEEAAKKATGWRPDSAAGRDVLYTDGKLTNTIRYNDNGLPAIGTVAGNAILDNMRRRAGYTEEQIAEMNKGRSAGGIVEKTGVAKIHDNEVILNASQTSFLRNEILGNKSNSLLGMLTDLQSLQRTASNTSTISNSHDASVIIENATVEMQVASIANDYDAQRAGEKALDKMLQIARKSQRQNRIGG